MIKFKKKKANTKKYTNFKIPHKHTCYKQKTKMMYILVFWKHIKIWIMLYSFVDTTIYHPNVSQNFENLCGRDKKIYFLNISVGTYYLV